MTPAAVKISKVIAIQDISSMLVGFVTLDIVFFCHTKWVTFNPNSSYAVSLRCLILLTVCLAHMYNRCTTLLLGNWYSFHLHVVLLINPNCLVGSATSEGWEMRGETSLIPVEFIQLSALWTVKPRHEQCNLVHVQPPPQVPLHRLRRLEHSVVFAFDISITLRKTRRFEVLKWGATQLDQDRFDLITFCKGPKLYVHCLTYVINSSHWHISFSYEVVSGLKPTLTGLHNIWRYSRNACEWLIIHILILRNTANSSKPEGGLNQLLEDYKDMLCFSLF